MCSKAEQKLKQAYLKCLSFGTNAQGLLSSHPTTGGVAQMVERSLSMWEVPGSIPGASKYFFSFFSSVSYEEKSWFASSGNWTRADRVAGGHSTTEPTMLDIGGTNTELGHREKLKMNTKRNNTKRFAVGRIRTYAPRGNLICWVGMKTEPFLCNKRYDSIDVPILRSTGLTP